jgi:hypothetical protein
MSAAISPGWASAAMAEAEAWVRANIAYKRFRDARLAHRREPLNPVLALAHYEAKVDHEYAQLALGEWDRPAPFSMGRGS